ncbi:DUF1643 domain-containing protein [Paenibacillus sp. NPDC057934]|uniref:DUF1643 domain-containing protein n=1 Tax=Paenibacillus sp. NPDC057934 TaxID=3346282 RepID=UPI0036DC6E4C
MWFFNLANSKLLLSETGTFAGTSGNAVFDKYHSRRYFLEKRWEQGENIFTAIMMNPSNAAHNKSDKTVDQLINVAKAHDCHTLYVVNISSIISGSSSKLNSAHFAFEEINWNFISAAISEAKYIFIGWGIKGHKGILKQQKSNPDLVSTFKNALSKTYCYEVLKSEDKKYENKSLFFVPHPRPLKAQNKYSEVAIRKIKEHEFENLFFR